MRLTDVRKEIARQLSFLKALVQIVSDGEVADDGSVNAKGIAEDDVPGELARHYGFSSRPPDGWSGIVLSFFGVRIFISYRDPDNEPVLQKGETALHNSTGALVKADKDGNVVATAKAGQTFQANGNSSAMILDALLDDLKPFFFACQGTGAIVVGNTGVPTGSFLVKASDIYTKLNSGAYKSTKAKHS